LEKIAPKPSKTDGVPQWGCGDGVPPKAVIFVHHISPLRSHKKKSGPAIKKLPEGHKPLKYPVDAKFDQLKTVVSKHPITLW